MCISPTAIPHFQSIFFAVLKTCIVHLQIHVTPPPPYYMYSVDTWAIDVQIFLFIILFLVLLQFIIKEIFLTLRDSVLCCDLEKFKLQSGIYMKYIIKFIITYSLTINEISLDKADFMLVTKW